MKTLFLIVFFISTFSFAGPHIIGNGGSGLVCDQSSKFNTQLLDVFEMGLLLNLKAEYDSKNNYKTLALNFIERLSIFSRIDMNQLKSWVKTFESESLFLDEVELVAVEDSVYYALPMGCLLQQAVIQKEPSLPGDQRYIINNRLWRQFDDLSKASLIIHEVIYRLFIINFGSYENQNSLSVRRTVSFVVSNHLKKLTSSEIFDLQKSLGFFVSQEKFLNVKNNIWLSDPVQVKSYLLHLYKLEFDKATLVAKFSKTCSYINFHPAYAGTAYLEMPFVVTDSSLSTDAQNDETSVRVNPPGENCLHSFNKNLGGSIQILDDKTIRFQNILFRKLE